jgi:hypothetical protein
MIKAIAALVDVHRQVEELAQKDLKEQAMQLLEQCQQNAIDMGGLIDSTEGENTQEVHLLEEYCELLYQIHVKLEEGDKCSNLDMIEMLNEPLRKVAYGVVNNFQTQLEVVFLPYKASMWDSLESVWKEMKDDPNVNAFVVPIPYYDRLQGGKFGQVHYEANLYPKYVPVLEFDKYNFEERHPDVIYYHNPYDGNNFVTSVHPFFYSSNLKKFTDELVYIPYFVLEEINNFDDETLRRVESFVLQAGVINANRVIVQSENWKKAYVELLSRYTTETDKGFWENRIEVSKSPKLVKVANMKAEDFEIPEEWQQLIGTGDNKKKVIFYNVSVSTLINAREKEIDKIKRVLDTFKENRDKVVLLWRPHPLAQTTLTSMVPQLLQPYNEIVDNYRKEGWGIYDDTPDVDRAIAVSDAYYGDPSSLVTMYKETGKPIMIQNCDV